MNSNVQKVNFALYKATHFWISTMPLIKTYWNSNRGETFPFMVLMGIDLHLRH